MKLKKAPNYILIVASIGYSSYASGVFICDTFMIGNYAFLASFLISFLGHYFLVLSIRNIKQLGSDILIAVIILAAVIYTDLSGMRKLVDSEKRLPIRTIENRIADVEQDLLIAQNEMSALSVKLADEKNYRIKQGMNALQKVIAGKKAMLTKLNEDRVLLIDKAESEAATSHNNVAGGTIILITLAALASFEKKEEEEEMKPDFPVVFRKIKGNKDDNALRDKKVLRLLELGVHQAEIAEIIGISTKTIQVIKKAGGAR